MVKYWLAVGCNSSQRSTEKLHIYRIPKVNDRRDKWIAAISRKNWTPTDNDRLCSKHFISGKLNLFHNKLEMHLRNSYD